MNEIEKIALEALQSAINNTGFVPCRFVEETCKWHRYLQNELFKLAIWIIKVYGSNEYDFDPRNQYAHETAKNILESGAID